MKFIILTKLFCFLLIIFYLFVFFLIFIPRTDPEYYGYFISRQISIHPGNLQRFKHMYVSPGKIYPASSDYLAFFSGWSPAEETHTWNDGYEAIIKFNTLDNNFSKIKIKLSTYGEQNLTIKLNGHVIFSKKATFQEEFITLDAKNKFKKGTNILEFLIPDAKQPNKFLFETRTLGVRIFEMEFI